MTLHYIACDLGASSGRIMLGTLDGKTLRLDEIHRFPTRSDSQSSNHAGSPPTLKWDLANILEEITLGLQKVAALKIPVRSISTDSWGVDYVWLDSSGQPLADPFHYRDSRTWKYFTSLRQALGDQMIFEETGIQFMPINTLYQLADDQAARPDLIQQAVRFLPIADYVHSVFCGRQVCEASMASTTQIFNPRTGHWSIPLIEHLGIPHTRFPEVVQSGQRLGPLLPEYARRIHFLDTVPPVEVVTGCSHDTGAAVAAVPAHGGNWAFLSSGTWSLIGVETSSPVLHATAQQLNFTNELGYNQTIRLLKNSTGLWILQQCQQHWTEQGQTLDYQDLLQQAAQAPAFRTLIRPDSPEFLQPGNMPETIRSFCKQHRQAVPESPGEFTRCILESLALSYRLVLDQLQQVTGQPIDQLHIVGGGSRNTLLNQFTANATGLPTWAGPQEATAIGNILIQAVTMGDLSGPEAIRQTVRYSFPPTQFVPSDRQAWEQARRRFQQLDTGLSLPSIH